MSCCVAYLGVVSSLSLVSVMYVPTQSQLKELELQDLMWGNNIQNWERLHVTVTLETKKLAKSGCEYAVSLLPVDSDGFPLEIETGQLHELGCATQICAFVDGVKVCDVNENPESDFEVDTVMGKCHMSIPTALAYYTINTKRFVGLNATWLQFGGSSAGNYTCEITHLDDMTLTVTLEPFTAMYDCEDNFFWSHQDEECKPCQNEDILSLCPPGHFVRGCDALAHVGESYCSPCENTPDNFDAGFYAWHPTSECVLECVNNQQHQYFMNGTVCSPCTQSLRTCSEDPENNCCAKTPGKMWQACTSSQNEQCVDCPEILKLQYSQNEVHIPWTSDCESYFIQSFYTLPKEPPYCECQTTCVDNHYRSLTIPNVPCVPCSTGQELLLTAEASAEAGETYKFQQCTKASNTQILQCERKELGCDGIPYSGKVFDLCDVCGGDNTTCTGCDGIINSGKKIDECGICDGDSTTCQGCDGVPNSGLVVDVCGQCGGDNTSCWGCDNVSNSGLVFDACGECGGDGSSCWGCDNVSNSGLVFDACDVCGGDNATCTGCDGVLFSGKVVDSCGVCDGGDKAQDGCGVCYGDNTSCIGCDGIYKSGIFNDSCGVCGGDNSTCAGCDGIPYSGKVIDSCNVCGGDNTSCIGCDGVFNSGKKNDECNVCGGDNTTCECDIGYTGPQYGKLSSSCVLCGPGTYKDVIGSAACTECGFDTYNPQHGSTSSNACLPCMEQSETEEIYGHESIHACMCISGYYHDTLTSCTACTPGTFNDEKNQTQCSNCSAGYYSNGPNSSTCQICPNATYSHEGSALCTPCNLNASSPEGSDSIGDCVCDVGFYADITQQSQFGTVSTEFATTSSHSVRDVKLSNDGQWAVFVDTLNIYHIDLSIAERTITTVRINVHADSVCVDSTNNNIIYGDANMHLYSVDLTNPSAPVSSNLLTSMPNNKRVQGACVVTSDRFVIFTDLKHIHEYSFSTNSVYRTISNLGEYSGDARIYALTVTGEDDNIILYSSNHKIWKLNRVYDVNPVLVAGSYEGSLDGAYNVAQFVHPSALTMSVDHKTIYLNTEKNIRAIDYDTGTVSTVAGALVSSTTGDDGCTDGTRNQATFFFNTVGLGGMTLSTDGTYLLVPGWDCHNIRRVDLVTQVTSHCLACAAGTYKDILGPQACEPCASCPAGQYRLGCTTSSPGACVDCPSCGEGQYRVNCAGQSTGECVDCATRAASVCEANTYLFNCGGSYGGACSPCASCLAGEQRNGCTGVSAGSCGACPSGTFKPSAGTEPCQTCPTCSAGKYQIGTCDALNVNTCADCVAGKYSNVAGLSACLNCQAGTISDAAAATACTACAAGTSSATASTCQDCQPGEFAASTGSSICSDCEGGKISSASLATTCSTCSAGTFSTTGTSVCQDCQPGEYADSAGASTCLDCAAGSFSSTTAASSCTPCAAGTYAATAGTSTCTNCPANLYHTGTGGTACFTCAIFTCANTLCTQTICTKAP